MQPYIHAQMKAAHTDGIPPMRPLFVDFPDDHAAWSVEDQFMLGPDLLVAPITSSGARERDVLLPPGRWADAWTGDMIEGGRTVRAAAPLEHIPVFIREGARVPVAG
jgi:alpha-D-xyloside xylohydrolase